MADKLREGVDLHLHFAAQILGISYEEALKRQKEKDPEIKQTRQTAKAANFGYPGGMGANSFRSFAKGYGLNLSEKQAGKLKEDWFLAWPEMRDYFRFIHTTIGDEIGTIEQFVSKRKRGGVRFTQACNSMFQGLAADGAKEALFEVSRRCYTEPESALYGSRPVMFIHDEIVLESPQDLASKAADELALVMRERMSRFTPDIPIKTTVAIMDRWYKEADETRNERGELQIWRAENG
jgi:DNA polymerase-1